MSRAGLKSRGVEALVRLAPRLLALRGKLPGRRGTELFCDPLDAHSWLLVTELWRHRARLPDDFRLHWMSAPGPALDPEPELRSSHASHDVGVLAEFFQFDLGPSPGQLCPQRALTQAAGCLEGDGLRRLQAAAERAPEVFCAPEPPSALDYAAAAPRLHEEMRRGVERQAALGHYQGAMLYHGGEWFWGVDRLPLWLAQGSCDPVAVWDARVFRAKRAPGPPGQPPRQLEVYFSFRSPYSYLALGRVAELAQHYGLELRLRPVLPMVMRGFAVPRAKKYYILFDAAREARRLQIPFGRISDPVGSGAERCLAAFVAADHEDERLAFSLAACEAIWSQGIDVATDSGLARVCARSGLAWTRVQAAVARDEWRGVAEGHRAALSELGLWGVPSFRLGERVLWGQDRVRVLQRMLARDT